MYRFNHLILCCLFAIGFNSCVNDNEETIPLVTYNLDSLVHAVPMEKNTIRDEVVNDETSALQKQTDSLFQNKNIVEWVKSVRATARSFSKNRQEYLAIATLESAKENIWWTKDAYHGKIILDLAHRYNRGGSFKKALDNYEAAQDIHENKDSLILWVRDVYKDGIYLYKPLANLYTRIGEDEKAQRFLNFTLAQTKASKDWVNYYRVVGDLAKAMMNQDRYVEALKLVKENLIGAYDINKTQNITNEIGILELVKAEILIHQKDIGTISDLDIRNALDSISDQYPETKAIGMQVLGAYYEQKKDFPKARETYYNAISALKETSYNQNRREIIKMILAFAMVDEQEYELEEALNHTQLALKLLFPKGKKELTYNPGQAEFYPEITILEALDQKGNLLLKNLGSHHTASKRKLCLETHLSTLRMEEYLSDIYAYNSSNLKLLKDNRKNREQFFYMLELCQKNKDIPNSLDLAFEFIEKSKAVLLNQEIQNAEMLKEEFSDEIVIHKKLQEDVNDLHNQILALELGNKTQTEIEKARQELAVAKEIYLQNLEKLKAKSKLLKKLDRHEKEYDLTACQNQIENDSLLILSYFLGERAIYSISITSKEAQFKKKKIPSNFRSWLKEYTTKVADRNFAINNEGNPKVRKTFVNDSQYFYATLIGKRDLGFFNQLVVVPDMDLANISFDMLLPSKERMPTDEFWNLPYLIKRFPIQYAYSLRSLTKMNSKETKMVGLKNFAGFAPDYSSCSLSEVRGSYEIVDSLATMFTGDSFGGSSASLAGFKNKALNYKMLLYYGHAKGISDRPLYSWLAFTQKEKLLAGTYGKEQSNTLSAQRNFPGKERLLFAKDISQLDLNADFFFLNGCSTGAGAIAPGEGVLSLSRAFRAAGCPSLVSTLWDVNQREGQFIVQAFFKYVKAGFTKSKALQLAKVSYLKSPKSKRYPHYWAAHTLIGQDGKVKFN